MSLALSCPEEWHFVLDEPVRLLVTDDDPIFREFASVQLASPVATIETAADGLDAWIKLKAAPFDLALIDVDMPGLTGFELVERVRNQASLAQLPLIVVTGREDIASIDRAYRCGATSFAAKPVNWRVLSYQIKYVLRACRAERQTTVRM